MRYSSTLEDAEDILQDGFVKIFKNLENYRSEGALGGWMRRIMINTALQKFREEKRLSFMVPMEDRDEMIEVEEEVLEKMSAMELMDKIRQLPDGFRLVFNLYAVEGFSHSEIASKLGISEGTSRSQYSRSRSLLRKMIEEEQIREKAI